RAHAGTELTNRKAVSTIRISRTSSVRIRTKFAETREDGTGGDCRTRGPLPCSEEWDHCGICSALAILGQIAQRSGNLDEAAIFLVDSDEHARFGESPDLRGITLRNLAELARMQGDLASATALYEAALAVARTTGTTFGV